MKQRISRPEVITWSKRAALSSVLIPVAISFWQMIELNYRKSYSNEWVKTGKIKLYLYADQATKCRANSSIDKMSLGNSSYIKIDVLNWAIR